MTSPTVSVLERFVLGDTARDRHAVRVAYTRFCRELDVPDALVAAPFTAIAQAVRPADIAYFAGQVRRQVEQVLTDPDGDTLSLWTVGVLSRFAARFTSAATAMLMLDAGTRTLLGDAILVAVADGKRDPGLLQELHAALDLGAPVQLFPVLTANLYVSDPSAQSRVVRAVENATFAQPVLAAWQQQHSASVAA